MELEQKSTKVQDTYYYLLIGLIVLACACSIFAQIPELNPALKSLLTYVPWIFSVIYMVFYINLINIKHFALLLLPAFVFFLYALGQLFKFSYNFNTIRTIFVSCLIFAVGIVLGENISVKHFKFILKAVCVATIIVSVYFYIVVLGGGDLYTERENGVATKNSIALIITVPIVIMLYSSDIFPKLRWVIVPFLVFLVILIGSRACMVCCLGALLGKVFIGNRTKKEKILYTIFILIAVYMFIMNDKMYDKVINEIFLKGKELNEENMDKITSGRTKMQEGFWVTIKQCWFVGGQGYAYENFYMDMIGMFGLFGAIPLFIFAFAPIIYFFKDYSKGKNNDILTILLVVDIVMLINGIAETLTPFGPGVKCFVLWLTFGYYIGLRYRIKGER